MIDSLIGVGMLVMLTGWMAGLVSVQYSLSSSRRALSQAEQFEYLRALNADGLTDSENCNQLLLMAKDDYALESLQTLLVTPELAQRDDLVILGSRLIELQSNGDIPYSSLNQRELLLRQGPATEGAGTLAFVRGDWQVTRADGLQQPLFIC